MAPNIVGQTPTVGTPSASQPQVLIPVTGADLSGKQAEKQVLASRTNQLQTGMNLLGFGLLLMGIMLMGGKKED